MTSRFIPGVDSAGNPTFNIPNCHCKQDHDRIAWLTYAVLASSGLPADVAWQLGEEVEELATAVGWSKSTDTEALRNFVADFDALQNLPTVAEPQKPKTEPRYDLIQDTVYVDEEDEN